MSLSVALSCCHVTVRRCWAGAVAINDTMHVIGGTCLEGGHVYEDTLTYEFEKNEWCTDKDDRLLEPR